MELEINLQDDVLKLHSYARQKKYGKISSRLRAVAFCAQHETIEEISERLGYCRQTICDWIHRYNADGMDGLYDLPRPGQPKRLSPENESLFRQRITAGPTNEDGVSAFTGKVLISILKNEFNAKYSLSGIYNLLQRLNLSSLLPRPRHEKNNLEAMDKWKEELPLVVAEVKKKSRKRDRHYISRRKQVRAKNPENTCMG
jgi:transposase